MTRVSNTIIGILNSIFLVFGIVTMVTGAHIYTTNGTQCQKTIQDPLLVVGLMAFVLALIGLMGACCRHNTLLTIYLVAIFFVIIGLIGVTIFSLLIAHEGAGKAAAGLGFREYKLGDFSNWLQEQTTNPEDWKDTRACLLEEDPICQSLKHTLGMNESEFKMIKLSPVQSGCCKPPLSCGFEYENATLWTVPKSGPKGDDPDCNRWRNEQNVLCYDCDSCKAGVVANLRQQYIVLAAYNVLVITFLMIVYSIGCCAKSNNKYGHARYSAYSKA